MKKIIQISSFALENEDEVNDIVWALCDDGSLWRGCWIKDVWQWCDFTPTEKDLENVEV